MRTAQRAIHNFWLQHWEKEFTGSYDPPEVIGLYDGEDPTDAPTCGERPLDVDNASYCDYPEHSVAWDETLMRRGMQLGDAWVYLVIAHEWGHAIQGQLDDEYVPDSAELQADCLAAAALYGADADGNFIFEDGDLDEVIDGLQEVADKTAWTEVGDHGDATERISWFQKGKQDGVPGCFEEK